MKKPILISLCLLFSSCAGMKENWIASQCNHGAAYEKGMNDSRSGQQMNSEYSLHCPEKDREAVRTGYREGYTAGVGSMKVPVPHTQINVNVGPSAPTWRCEVRAFTGKFEGFGKTEAEASHNAKTICAQKHHEMHCRRAECQAVK